jgi:hypothetical protein
MKHTLLFALLFVCAGLSAQTYNADKIIVKTGGTLTLKPGTSFTLNGYGVTGISNDPTLADSSTLDLVTEAAVNKFVKDYVAANGGGGGGGSDSTSVLRTDINNLQALSGRADGSTNMGTYTGTTITDNQTIKQNLQQLETAVEGKLSTEVDGSTSNELTTFTSASSAPGSPKVGDIWHDSDGDSVFIRTSAPAWAFLAIRAASGGGSTSTGQGVIVSGGTASIGNAPGGSAGAFTTDRNVQVGGNSIRFVGDAGLQVGGARGIPKNAVVTVVSDGSPHDAIQIRGANNGFDGLLMITDTTVSTARQKDETHFFLRATPGGTFGGGTSRDYTYSIGYEPGNTIADDSIGKIKMRYESLYHQGGLGYSPPGDFPLGEWGMEHEYVPGRVSTIPETRFLNYAGRHDGGGSSLGINADIVTFGDIEQRNTVTLNLTGNTYNTERMRIERGMFMQWDSAGFYPLGQTVSGSFKGLIKANNDGSNSIGQASTGFTFESTGGVNLWTPTNTVAMSLGTSAKRIADLNIFTNNPSGGLYINNSTNAKTYGLELLTNSIQLRNTTDNTVPFSVHNTAPSNSLAIDNDGTVTVGAASGNYMLNVVGQKGTVALGITGQTSASGYGIYQGGTITGGSILLGGNVSASGTLDLECWNNNSASATADARVRIRTSNSSSDPVVEFSAAGSADNWRAGVDNSQSGDPFQIQFSSVLNTTAKGISIASTDGAFTNIGYGSGSITGTPAYYPAWTSGGRLIERTAAQLAGDIAATTFVNGGNSFSTNATIGTNNTRPLSFETAGTRRMSIPSSGINSTTTATKALMLSSNDSLEYMTIAQGAWSATATIASSQDTLLNGGVAYGHLHRVGNVVTFTLRFEIALGTGGNANTVYISPPVASNFTQENVDVIGTANLDTQGASSANISHQRAYLFASTSDDKIGVSFDPVGSLTYPSNRQMISVSGSYVIN